MSIQKYHRLCQRGIGRAVEIRTRNGRVYRGVIDRVDESRVYLRRMSNRQLFGGFGYGWHGGYGRWGGWGFGRAFVFGIAIGVITSLIFI